jgi:hypothetical protein
MMAAAEAAMHRDHDRPPSVGPKRMREWEDEPAVKKPASDENRARMEDMRHRRPSTPPRDREPYRRNSSEARRFEEQRRMEDQRRVDGQRRMEDMRRAEEHRHANDGYHPSEAAHHPPTHSMPPSHLPPMQQGPPPPPPPTMQNLMHDAPPPSVPVPKEYGPGPEERPQRLEQAPPAPHPPPVTEPERAARKMDVDDDYDDDGEEDKKPSLANGATPVSGPAAADIKTTTPTSASIGGMLGGPKEAA